MADLKKENKIMNVYLHHMKTLLESLTSIGMPLCNDEFISSVLTSLDNDYDALFEVVNSCTNPMRFVTYPLSSRLQSNKMCLNATLKVVFTILLHMRILTLALSWPLVLPVVGLGHR
jgi:hypothetical protein